VSEAQHAHLAHVMPGRLRLRLPGSRGRPERLERVRRRIAAHPEVTAVEVDHRTGSVLVQGGIAVEALSLLGEEEDLFSLVPPAALRPLAEDVMQALENVDQRLSAATGGRLGVVSASVAALLAYAAVQLARGRVEVPATTLVWYAFTAMLLARAGRHRLT
jgi:hypothetical protein